MIFLGSQKNKSAYCGSKLNFSTRGKIMLTLINKCLGLKITEEENEKNHPKK